MNKSYDQREPEKKTQQLKPLLTDNFLKTLVEAAKVCGWNIDHCVTADFVDWCFEVAEKPAPDLEPYDYSVNEE